MTRLPILKALIAGVILGFVVMGVGGLLAAIAWPPWFAEFARGHSRMANLISDTALYVLPIGVLAFFFGVGLFGWLKPARTSLLIACVAGYLGIALLADMLRSSPILTNRWPCGRAYGWNRAPGIAWRPCLSRWRLPALRRQFAS